MKLTPEQQRAVERSGQNVCVVAGPGAGKTRVLIERFAWLVEQSGVDPARILAITFTEKAAVEIKERLVKRFGQRPELREAIERAWVSTIDGFCARLLRENALAAALAPDFAVLDQPRAERLKRASAEEALDQLFQERPAEMQRLLEAIDLSTQDDGRQPDLARSLLLVYETMRVAGLRELPPPPASGDARAAACDLVRIALADPTIGKTANQRIAHKRIKEWAAAFLSIAPEPVTLAHFESIKKFSVNLGHFVQGSAARLAATQLKQDTLPRLEAQLLERWNHGQHDLLRTAIERIDRVYRGKKRRDAGLDFGDLEEQAIALLESDAAVRQDTADQFDEILMDELQDTNRLQWRLVDLLLHGPGEQSSDADSSGARTSSAKQRRFFAVGDINQSIYGFRHAEPAVFEEYRQGLLATGAVIDDLRENHRSRTEILETVVRLLHGQPGIEARPLVAVGEFEPARGPVVERLVGRGDRAQEAEAGMVAAKIRGFYDAGRYQYSDVAILVRTLGALEPFEAALDRFGIPFLVSGGRTFLEARAIRDLLALLAAMVNPLDEIALVGVLRGPLVGLSDQEIFRMGREGWREQFEKRFGHLRSLAGFAPPDRLLATALDESGYAGGLPLRARGNIEKLFAWMRSEWGDRPRPLAELLDELEELRATQSEAEAPPPEAGNAVSLMSIHAAKGLEFPVVFVSALHRGPDRRKPVIACSAAAGLGVKWRNPATGKGQSDTAHAALMEELRQKEEAEENRLLYVATTRAQDRLILSYAERGRSPGWQKLAEIAIREASVVEGVSFGEEVPVAPALVAVGVETMIEELSEPPLVTGQYDSSAAVTAVALFHACPHKYYLSRYLGLKGDVQSMKNRAEEGRELPGGVTLGSDVHAILAGAPDSISTAEALELARRFVTSELGQRAGRAPRIEKEFDFLLTVEGVVLRGQIDLWFEEAGELIVVDYKTDRDESSSEEYALQLRLYALALEKYAGRLPDRAVLYYLRPNHAIDVSLSRRDLDAARAAVRTMRDAQESLEFPMNVGEQCRRCPYRAGLCPAT